jgi:hypothetical protein
MIKLCELPPDILLLIAGYLPVPARLSLKLTSTKLYSTFETLRWSSLRHAEKVEFLILLRSSIQPGQLLCSFCTKYRPAKTAFTKEQYASRDKERYCIDCAIGHKIWLPGTLMGTVGTEWCFHCRRCSRSRYRPGASGVDSKSVRLPFKQGHWMCGPCVTTAGEKANKKVSDARKVSFSNFSPLRGMQMR